MKRKATGTVHSNSKSSARPGDKRQQLILDGFIGKTVTDSNDCRVEENPRAITWSVFVPSKMSLTNKPYSLLK